MRLTLLLLLALCVTASAASAAPLPPLPPVVKRPAPLLSPKHASAPKAKTMVKASGFTPAGGGYAGPLAPCLLTHQLDQLFFQDIVDITHIECIQRPGRNVVFEYCDDAFGTSWGRMAFFGPCVAEQFVTVEWYHAVSLRRACRVFRVREEVVTGLRPASVIQQVTLNPMLQLRSWKKPK